MNFNDKTNKFIEKNVNVKAKISELSSILSRLSFTDSDIASVIDKICSQGKVKVFYEIVDMLNDLYFKDKIFEPNHKNAVKRIILDTIDLYEEDAENISKEIKKVLILAKKKGISPYNIAIKTNIRISTVEKFEQTLEALTKEKYNLTSTEKTELFSEEESKIILEQCASIACRVNAENLSNIIDLLRKLSFDKETKSYVFSVKDLLTQVPSLMGVSAKRIETAINLFELICDVQGKDSKKEIMLNIKKNPSILLINGDKINAIGNVCEDILFSLAKKVDKNLDGSNFRISFNYLKLKKFIYNFDNLNSLNSTDEKTLISKAKILEKFLGTKNAINCFLNNHIFLCDICTLKFALSYLAKIDKKNKNNDLKTAFVENPSKFLKSFIYYYDKKGKEKQKGNALDKQNKTKARKPLNLCYNDFPNLEKNYLEKIVKEYQSISKEQYNSFVKSVSTILAKIKKDKAQIALERKIAKKEKKSKLKNKLTIDENIQEENTNTNTNKETAQNSEKEENQTKVDDAPISSKDKENKKEIQLPLTNYIGDLPVYKSPFKSSKKCSFNEAMFQCIKTVNALFDNLYKKQKKLLEKEDYLEKCYIGKPSIKTVLNKIAILQQLEKNLNVNLNSVRYASMIYGLDTNNKELRYRLYIYGYKHAKQKDWTLLRDNLDSILSTAIEIEDTYQKTISLIAKIDSNLWNELKSVLTENEISRNVLFKEFVFNEFIKIIENLYEYFSEDIIKQVFGFSRNDLVNFLYDQTTNCQFLDDLKVIISKMRIPYKYSFKEPYFSKLSILEDVILNKKEMIQLNFHLDNFTFNKQEYQNFINENFYLIPNKTISDNFDASMLILQKIKKFIDAKDLKLTPYYDENDDMYIFIDNSGDIYSKHGYLCFSKNDDRYLEPNENSKRITITNTNAIIINKFGEEKKNNNDDEDGDNEDDDDDEW